MLPGWNIHQQLWLLWSSHSRISERLKDKNSREQKGSWTLGQKSSNQPASSRGRDLDPFSCCGPDHCHQEIQLQVRQSGQACRLWPLITSVFAREHVGSPEACCSYLTERGSNCWYLWELLTQAWAQILWVNINLPFNMSPARQGLLYTLLGYWTVLMANLVGGMVGHPLLDSEMESEAPVREGHLQVTAHS